MAIAGVTAYRTAFGQKGAPTGPQPDRLGDARLWVLPNPSGLNAHTTAPKLAELQEMREALRSRACARPSGQVRWYGTELHLQGRPARC